MANTPQVVAGVQSLANNGVFYKVTDNATYQTTILKREPLLGMDGSFDYKESPDLGFIEVSLRDDGSFTISDLYAECPATVVLTLSNGKVVSLTQGIFMEPPSVDSNESTFKCKWQSRTVVEVLSR